MIERPVALLTVEAKGTFERGNHIVRERNPDRPHSHQASGRVAQPLQRLLGAKGGATLEAITGVFNTQAEAEKTLRDLRDSGLHVDRTTLLTPGSNTKILAEMQGVPQDSSEQPGMGGAMGALLGGSVGFASGSVLLALVPGLGPVTAVGLLGASILAAAGATLGLAAGNKVERAMSDGIPEDEIFVYEDALRKGRSVVIALTDDSRSTAEIREILSRNRAESIDAAREQWWIGLRSAEESRYPIPHKFSADEQFFRLGFEAAMHARTRCMEFDQISGEMNAALDDVKAQYPGANVEEPFLAGYQRGREHYQQLCDETEQLVRE